ncbi:hypothetical protein [Halanaerobaculum tunisiense]
MDWDILDSRELSSGSNGSGEECFVSISPRRIYISKKATNLIGVDKRWAMLGLNQDENLLGMNLLSEKKDGAFYLKESSGKTKSLCINSKNLAKKVIGFDIKKRKRYPIHKATKEEIKKYKIPEKNMYIIDLNQEL